ncbi:Ribosome biogenesis protein brx1 [Gonapodya sp. JEL0774]|nr:Ribosome biogenesis protein brx1 [Gonapodya sp. JEL0774]
MRPSRKQRTITKNEDADAVLENRHRELVVADTGRADSDSDNFEDDSDDEGDMDSDNELDAIDSDDEMRSIEQSVKGVGKGGLSGRKALLVKAETLEAPEEEKRDMSFKDRHKSASEKAGVDEKLSENRQRVLLLSSRGIIHRYRHLLNDLNCLLPHSKKESKLEQKSDLYILNEVAELANCNNAIFLECRRGTDLYMWMSKTPNGPSVKFFVQNAAPQIVEKDSPVPPGQDPLSLVEIGPRFVLDIVRIFDGSFCGSTLYENSTFVTPGQIRRSINGNAGHRYSNRKVAEELRSGKLAAVAGVADDQEERKHVFS